MVLREVGLGVDESLEIEDGETRRKVEVEELLVEGMVGRDDRYGDSRHIGGVERARWEWSGGLVWCVPCVVIAHMHVARMVSVCSGVTGRRLAGDFGESDTRAAS